MKLQEQINQEYNVKLKKAKINNLVEIKENINEELRATPIEIEEEKTSERGSNNSSVIQTPEMVLAENNFSEMLYSNQRVVIDEEEQPNSGHVAVQVSAAPVIAGKGINKYVRKDGKKEAKQRLSNVLQ